MTWRNPLQHRGWEFWPRRLALRLNMQRGRDVARWQMFLQGCGFWSVAADGIYGARTHDATVKYLARHGIKGQWSDIEVPRLFRYKLYAIHFVYRVMRALQRKRQKRAFDRIATDGTLDQLIQKRRPHMAPPQEHPPEDQAS